MKLNKLCLTAIFCTLAAGSLIAQTAVPLAWDKISKFTENQGVLTFSKKTAYLCSKPFAVNPNKTYTLTATMRSQKAAANEKSLVFLAFIGVDAQGQNIDCWKVLAMPGTFTTLAADAQKGDKILKVKDAGKFILNSHHCLVFNAKADESDIPNKFRMTSRITDKVQKDGYWEVTLRSPLPRKFIAGTPIRQHSFGGYLYPIGARNIGEEWVTYSAPIKGVLQKSGWHNRTWPKGTVKGRVIILPNWKFKNLETQFKDIRLIEQ